MKSSPSVASRNRRKKVLKQAKGMQHARRRSYRLAKQGVTRSLEYAYRDRRNRKREFHKLWIKRLNNATREHGIRYSEFINLLKKSKSGLNRKVLANIAYNEPETFNAIVKSIQK